MPQKYSRTVSRRNFLASTGTVGAIVLAGCTENPSTNGGADLSGNIIVKGSSTVFPISDKIAQEFMNENPEVNVTVDSTGTGGGFKNFFCLGDSDVNGASRTIKDAERTKCSNNDVEFVEFKIAKDALTVAVNNNNDWVDCISIDELSQIWRENGAQSWSDVRSNWPADDFVLHGPASTSGTYDWFNTNVIGEDQPHTTAHQPTENDHEIVRGIKDNQNSMGYFGFAYYNQNTDQVKALSIKGSDSGSCTKPSLANAKDGSYPLARPLYIYVNKSSLERDGVYQFIKFYLEQTETDLVSEVGYVPSSAEQRDQNLQKLRDAAGR